MARGHKTGGRQKGTPNKATRDIREAAMQYTPDALKTLHQVMQSSESDAARVAAAAHILDRAYGKPKQSTELTGADGGPIAVLTETERAARVASLLERAVQRKKGKT